MELTATNVEDTVRYCLPDELADGQKNVLLEGGTVDGLTVVRGVKRTFVFITAKLQEKREDIRSMLSRLPDPFHAGKGDGWSFLNACVRQDEMQWGEQPTVDDLLCLGLGLGLVEFLIPRDLWQALPGGVPYFCVKV